MSRMSLPANVRLIDASRGFGTSDVVAPMLVNGYTALTVPPWFRAMRFLSEALASFPRSVHKDGARPAAGAPPHPVDRLLKRRPNPLRNPFVFWSTWYLHACHTGNGYARVRRDPLTYRPTALENLPPERVVPFQYDPSEGVDGLQQWYYDTVAKEILPAADVLHLSGLGWAGMSGADPVDLHAGALNRAAMLDAYATKFVQKGTVIRSAVLIKKSMDDEKLAQFRAVLRTFQGPAGEDGPLILTDDADIKNVGMTPQEGQIAEQGNLTVRAVAQITGVPPALLMDLTDSRYSNNVEMQGQDVVRYCLRPWLVQAEDELTAKLLTEAELDEGYTVKIDPNALLRGDTKAVNDSVTATTNAGLTTKNEGRAVLGYPPSDDPGADKLKAIGDTAPATAPLGAAAA
ncbi:MAG: Phage portal protein family [Phycisphaerales bacterium]|nr:Phage portal protein family [Phycisphaerales bacterium]